ncbi:MAG: hypothetical protein MSH49_05970 [[Eubacterium] saphenum]|nr:hypothetical protein [[Eubacterium] saphenum]
MIYALQNSDFLKITDKNDAFYGGAQSWFSDKFSVNGGCGVVCAANILAYLAASDEKYAGLYPQNSLSKQDFTAFMEELCGFVKIRNFFGQPLGVWGKKRFEKGVLNYAKSRDVELSAVELCGKVTLENTSDYIKTALSQNLPVAMLIGFNRRLKNVRYVYPSGNALNYSFERHWVTITELSENGGKFTVKVSSWGAAAEIDLADFIGGEKIYSALVYFK